MVRVRAVRLLVAGTIALVTLLPSGDALPGASAAIRELAPSSLTLAAGSSGAVTVRITARQESCLSATTTAPDVHFSIDGAECGLDRDVNLVVHTSTATPPGTYTVEVRDRQSLRSLTLVVEPPPATTTSTTALTTTTATPTPTTAPTAPPPTTTTSTTSGGPRGPTSSVAVSPSTSVSANAPPAGAPAVPNEAPGSSTPAPSTASTPPRTPAPTVPTASADPTFAWPTPAAPATGATAFLPVADLVAKGPPERGLFLPFAIGAYPDCLPPFESCTDDRWDLVLVSATAADIVWSRAEPGRAEPTPPSGPITGLDVAVVGSPAPQVAMDANPSTASFVLTLLDLRASTAALRRVERSLDEQGHLTGPPGRSEVLAPSVEGPSLSRPRRPGDASDLLRPPRPATADWFIERSPVFVVSTAGPRFELVYGVLPAADHGVEAGLVPLLGASHAAYLVTELSGARGLYVPHDAAKPRGSGTTGPADTGRGAILVLAVVAVFVGLLAWFPLRARRPRPAG